MSILSDYDSFDAFFSNNRDNATDSFKALHEEFVRHFNLILEIGRKNLPSEQSALSMALYLRAVKYLYTANKLALTGHTEESRVLLRNVIELMIVGFLIFSNEEVFKLWKECSEESKKHISQNKQIEIQNIREKKYEIAEIATKYKAILDSDIDVKHLLQLRGEFSTYYSHENFFNLIARIESGNGKTTVYVGTSHKSPNDRISKNVQLTIDVLKSIEVLMRKII